MKLSQPLLFLALALVSISSHALEPWVPTDTEMASLPPFCKARFNEGSPEYKYWMSALGKDYGHTHHYCAGVNFLNRYHRARSKQGKSFNLNNAQTNFEYMVSHAAPSYSLMPDVHSNLGKVFSLKNQPAQAITHLNKAIELNPRQPRAYSMLADFYSGIKQPAKALEIITDGLRHNPDTKSLQRRYTELGGKLPYPASIEPTPAAEAEAAKPEEPPTPTPSSVESAASPTTVPPAPVETIAEPPIGSPTNPYCRFCPD
ncbi:MAG: tetratricopeptide repeat protein [Thiobacillus sp.]